MSFGLPSAVIDKLVDIFREDARIQNVWLYGSRALGRESASSDIDLCIKGNALQLNDLFAIEMRIDDLLLPWKVDLALKHLINNPELLEHIRRVGIDLLARPILRNFK